MVVAVVVVTVAVFGVTVEVIVLLSLTGVIGTDESSRTLNIELVATMLDVSVLSLTSVSTTGEVGWIGREEVGV